MESAPPSASNTAVHVTPALTVLKMPPDAVATNMIEGLSTTASMSSMRPPYDEGPMWRHFSASPLMPTAGAAGGDADCVNTGRGDARRRSERASHWDGATGGLRLNAARRW